MEKFFLNPDAFDLKLAMECLNTFSNSTGLGCTLMSVGGDVLHEAGFGCGQCFVCAEIGLDRRACLQSHEYGMREAERFGGKYVYFCMMGLCFCVSPIAGAADNVAKMIAGPFLMTELDDYVSHDLQFCRNLKGDAVDKIMPILGQVVYVQPERVHFLSTLLFITVSFINKISATNRMLENQDSESMQRHICDYIIKLKNEDALLYYPFDIERELLASVRASDKEHAKKLLNEVTGSIVFSLGRDFSRIRTRIYELFVLLSRAAIDSGAPPEYVFELSHVFFTKTHDISNIEDLHFNLAKAMNQLVDYMPPFEDVKNRGVIYKAVQFIQRNYPRKISLDEVAREVDLSASYFSKVFKSEIGCNFNTYMNIVRIGKSINLLLYDNLDLVSIASLVGFEDQSYFSKVFKQVTGVTPHAFRKSGGNAFTLWQKPVNGSLSVMRTMAEKDRSGNAPEGDNCNLPPNPTSRSRTDRTEYLAAPPAL
ncbi:MAG: AraC family transcriptional regulator [Synergistaceae bacterium]|jgi:AraC-like DNA-binding protein/ligand-binding sensor protein|nr:AraC family transcriptional regulator [Synergistaceae bacterium]